MFFFFGQVVLFNFFRVDLTGILDINCTYKEYFVQVTRSLLWDLFPSGDLATLINNFNNSLKR